MDAVKLDAVLRVVVGLGDQALRGIKRRFVSNAVGRRRLGISRARYVRVRDVSGEGAAPSAGFDLDAVGIVTAFELD